MNIHPCHLVFNGIFSLVYSYKFDKKLTSKEKKYTLKVFRFFVKKFEQTMRKISIVSEVMKNQRIRICKALLSQP